MLVFLRLLQLLIKVHSYWRKVLLLLGMDVAGQKMILLK
jgi:hypothetical protein